MERIEATNLFRFKSINYLMRITNNEEVPEFETNKIPYAPSLHSVPETDFGGNDVELIKLTFKNTVRPTLAQFNTQAFEELKNTGMFSMIKSQELKERINNYYKDLGFSFSEIKEDKIASKNETWLAYLIEEEGMLLIDIQKLEDPIQLLQNPKTVLILRDFANSAARRMSSANKTRANALELLNLLPKGK